MLINVDMLPAMNLTKPNMQRQYEQAQRKNRPARVVNDGGGTDQEQEGPREPYLLPADQDQTGPRLHEYYSKAILNQIA